MLTLALESSCDETACSLVRDGRHVLASVVASQHALHEEYAGVVPEIASRAHVEALLPVVREALAQAGVGLGMVDAIGVGSRPGLIGSLLVGVAGAKALAWSLRKPIVGVDHVHAHLYSPLLRTPADESPTTPLDPDALSRARPALGLVVSGGHTAMYEVADWSAPTRLGATIDDAIGEAYDKVATMLSLPYPGGPALDRLAQSANANDRAYDFPISRINPRSLDFSFSGLKTAVLYAIRGVPGELGAHPRDPASLSDDARRDVAASFQRAACAAIILKLKRALEHAKDRGVAYQALLAGGGVTANSRLRSELHALAREHALPVLLPTPALCMDNAAMIGGLAHHLLRKGVSHGMDLQARPTTAA
jgi:N6-L-threonylcarbamoyladenine synthase